MLKSRCSTEEVVMKRFIIWSSVALLLVAISIIIVARADGSGRHGWGGGRRWSHHGPLGYVAHEFVPTRDPLTSLREAADLCDV